jgi:hypothetical protein
MTTLGPPQFTQQLNTPELDEPSFLRRERVPACQQGENGFASADEIHGLFPNRDHEGALLTNR